MKIPLERSSLFTSNASASTHLNPERENYKSQFLEVNKIIVIALDLRCITKHYVCSHSQGARLWDALVIWISE